ncbi:hypothetical protein CR970_02270 [Candidatus Saccharibacteria bacterium]|nr:MAG: hypothetical protein CR970_02270 [Candidatus Saccharibacteria bacterium]
MTLLAIFIGTLLLSTLLFVAIRYMPRRINTDAYLQEWRDLQALCRDKSSWRDALQRADALLDKALRERRYKGKTMGARMVAAQRKFTNNDGVWFAHNVVKKLQERPNSRLKEQDVKAALVGFRSALKDLAALPAATTQNTRTTDAKDGSDEQ